MFVTEREDRSGTLESKRNPKCKKNAIKNFDMEKFWT